MKKLVMVAIALGLLGYVGCGSLTRSRNDEVVSQIKKVAIVGFSAVEPMPKGLTLNLSGGSEPHPIGNFISKTSEDVNHMYGGLVRAFASNMKWTVIPPSKMKTNSGYLTAFDRTMKGFQNKMPTHSGHQQFLVDGIMDNDGLRILGKVETD